MQLYLEALLKKLSSLLEIVIAIMLTIGIVLLCIKMAFNLGNIPNLELYPNYEDLLETCFNLIIGVELIRMVYHHTPNTVFEVLLFAIARQIIIDHSSVWGSLIGVCAIAVLFATRKYLFCEFDVADETIFSAHSRAKSVNKILGVNIPYQDRQTLEQVFLEKAQEFDVEVAEGACIYFHDCGIIIRKISKGKIIRIEVIRAIH